MSAPLRFLGLAVFAWVGVRAASLGLFPGQTALVPTAAATPLAAPVAARSEPQPYDAMTPPAPYGYPAAAPYPPGYGYGGYPSPYPAYPQPLYPPP